jgi:hypothetical protein
VIRCALRVAIVGVFAFSAGRVEAAPGDATRLEYARSAQAAACPDRNALSAQVSKRLGYDPFFHAARQTISVEIVTVDGALRAQMRLLDENGIIVGSRELHEQAGLCDELVASLALAISIALDPSAALGGAPKPARKVQSSPPESSEAAESASEPAEQEPPPKPQQSRAEERAISKGNVDPLRPAIRATVFADVGTAPSLAFGYRLGFDLGRSTFRFGAEFVQQLPASKDLAETGQARVSLLGGTVVPCFVRAILAGCAVVTLGALQTRGEDIPYESGRSVFYAALGGRIELAPILSRSLRLVAQVDASKPLTPVSLHVAGAEVWRTPFLTAAVGVGVRLRFH